VEIFSQDCKKIWDPNQVMVHHGSLSKSLREHAENFMKDSRFGVCLSTMTLEIGIDIGDIDAVVLAEVPWSVSSLLQRIGRGNRKSQKNRVFAFYQNELEREKFENMFRIASEGFIEDKDYSFDLSVIIQQIFSILYSSGKTEKEFHTFFSDFCNEHDLIAILTQLENKGWIEKSREKWYATTKLMDIGQYGFIHSNIPRSKVAMVIDSVSKQVLGEIGEIDSSYDETFLLGGKVQKITEMTDNKIFVKPTNKKTDFVNFKRHKTKGSFNYLLPDYLK
jgi:ATP-dependent Lhr-like helicase